MEDVWDGNSCLSQPVRFLRIGPAFLLRVHSEAESVEQRVYTVQNSPFRVAKRVNESADGRGLQVSSSKPEEIPGVGVVCTDGNEDRERNSLVADPLDESVGVEQGVNPHLKREASSSRCCSPCTISRYLYSLPTFSLLTY